MLNDMEKKTLKESWKLVMPISNTIGDLFYRRLFELKPEYKALFKSDMSGQKKKLVGMLAFIVKSMDWKLDDWREDVPQEHDLFMVVLALGRRHGDLYKIPEESYAVVGDALLWTLDYGLGDAFSDDVRTAWSKVYAMMSSMMIMGTKNSISRASAA